MFAWIFTLFLFKIQIGRIRTAQQLRREYREIDIKGDGQFRFLQLCMLYFKSMVLKEYYQRHETRPKEDLQADDITGVGYKVKKSDTHALYSNHILV